MKPSGAQLRQLKRDNLRYAAVLRPVPVEEWPFDPTSSGLKRIRLLRSRQFLVQVFDEGEGIIRLSVQRTEWDERSGRFREGVSWDELQRLKAEAGYPAAYAVELFPADEEVVNVANMRHLWVLPERPAFAWAKGAA